MIDGLTGVEIINNPHRDPRAVLENKDMCLCYLPNEKWVIVRADTRLSASVSTSSDCKFYCNSRKIIRLNDSSEDLWIIHISSLFRHAKIFCYFAWVISQELISRQSYVALYSYLQTFESKIEIST